MYAILFLPFVISFVHSDDNIPNVADLPVFPESVGNVGNLDGGRNGLPAGFGSLGLAPLSNIGSAVGNVGQGGNGPGGIGNLPITGPPNNGPDGIGNLPITGFPNNGPGGIGNLPITGFPNNGPGGIGNLPITGFPNNGPGGIGNLPITGPPNNGPGGIGNLPITGFPNNGGGGLNFNPYNVQGGFGRNLGNLPQINNGLGGFGNFPIPGSQNDGQGGSNQNNGQGGIGDLPIISSLNGTLDQITSSAPAVIPDLSEVLKSVNFGQRDDGTGIERPCQSFDIYCIRRYFKKNSRCKEVRGPVPEPYFRAQSTLQITKINAAFSAFNVLYEGLNGRINEFYINRKTDRLVLSIEFRNVTFFSRDVYYRFYRPGKEPLTTYDYLYLNYESYITTTIIPKVRDLQLYKSETTTFTNDANPAFSIGPNAFSNPDSTVQASKMQLLANIPIVVQEAQLTEGPFSAATFIQHSICDFKLKVL